MKAALRLIVDGGNVRRYHTVSTHTQETVGHHSFVVAWLLELIYGCMPPPEVLMAALQHDLAEVETGDIPAPFKRTVAGLRDQFNEYEAKVVVDHGMRDYDAMLKPEERLLLKLADSMAGLVLCIHERKLGNTHVAIAYSRFSTYVTNMMKENKVPNRAALLFIELNEQWRQVHVS